MRHCIPCHSSFLQDPLRCPECSGRTLNEEELALWRAAQEELTDESFEVAAILEGPVEGALVVEVFEEAGIPYILRAHGADGFSMIFSPQAGWGVVQVTQGDVAQARELVAEIRRAARQVVLEEE